MFTKRQLEKYADVLIWALKKARKGKFRRGEVLLLRFDLPAVGLAEAVHERALDMGINPVMRAGLTPVMEHNFYKKAAGHQLEFVGPWESVLYRGIHGSVFINAPQSLTHLSDIDPKKIGKALVARKHLRDIARNREEKGVYGWTLCIFPTEELANRSGLSLQEYRNQVVRACYLDKADPVVLLGDLIKNFGLASEFQIPRTPVSRMCQFLNLLFPKFLYRS